MPRFRMRVMTLFSVLLFAVATLSATLTAPTAQAAPAGFSPERLIGPFPSDIPPGGTYIPPLDAFAALRADHPAIIAENLQTTIEINNSATPAQRRDAIAVNYDDRMVSLSYALGDRVGEQFRRLLATGRLPKVEQLASGYFARTYLPLGTTLLEKEYFDSPRPFEVAPRQIKRYDHPGGDIYASVSGNGSYPSGHTAMGYWKGALLASWLPEVGPQIIARAGEIGRSRIVLGVHYPLDVMGGRIMGQDITASRMADPAFAPLIREAGAQLREQLTAALGRPVAEVLAEETPYLTTEQALTNHRVDMTYGFDRLDPSLASTIPTEAAALLRGRFPHLSDAERLAILQRTAIPAGYPLDETGPEGGWVRIDLAAAYAAQP